MLQIVYRKVTVRKVTDCLEERFGKYRQLAGAQYHISIRQVYESERKLRLQNILELPEMETATAAVAVNDDVLDNFDMEVANDDYQKAPNLHATTYVAGYCAHAAFKKLSCMSCKENLMLEDNIEVEGGELVQAMTRGGLKFPQPEKQTLFCKNKRCSYSRNSSGQTEERTACNTISCTAKSKGGSFGTHT